MSVIIKKLLLNLATDKRFWKVVVGIIVGVFMLFIAIPGTLLQGISNAFDTMKVDDATFDETFGSAPEFKNLVDGRNKIYTYFSSIGIAASSPKAQIIYTVYLSDQNVDDILPEYCDFFLTGQNEDDIFEKIKNKFGMELSNTVIADYLSAYQQLNVPVEQFTNPDTINSTDFQKFVQWAQSNYWWCLDGTYGQPLTDATLNEYKQNHQNQWQQYSEYIQANLLGFHTVDDVGLYLAYCEMVHSGSVSGTAGVHSVTGNSLYNSATTNGNMDNYQGPAGTALLTADGQVWYYLGGGRVVTAGSPKEGIIYDYYKQEDYIGWFRLPDMDYS